MLAKETNGPAGPFVCVCYNGCMATTVSPWVFRIEQLVQSCIQSKNFGPDVSTAWVRQTLDYFAMLRAKNYQVTETTIPRDNPWIASLCMYVCLGDQPAQLEFSERQLLSAGTYLGMAQRAGWSNADMLQAIEWNKNSMPNYPTPEQWSSILEVPPEEILAIQAELRPTFESMLSEKDQRDWEVSCQLDGPFYLWQQMQRATTEAEALPLPQLDITS